MEQKINIVIEESMPTVFANQDRIYQDGTTPMYRITLILMNIIEFQLVTVR